MSELIHVPRFHLPLILTLGSFVSTMRPFVEHGRRRMWILSTIMTSAVAAVGAIQLGYWIVTKDGSSSAGMDYMCELLKAYLLVDLMHNAAFHFKDTPILDCWIHHIAYMYIFDWLITDYQSGVMRPFLILELPSAIRAVGSLAPSLRNDRAYGISFFALRVVWPCIAVWWMRATSWVFNCFFIAQGMHIYWFYKWFKSEQRRANTGDHAANNNQRT